MKRLISILLISVLLLTSLTACGSKGGNSESNTAETNGNSDSSSSAEVTPADTTGNDNAEIVDGKFAETRHITVEIFDRGNDGGSKPEDNVYTNFIKEGMLRDHNVDVTFVPVPRWTEVEQINNLLAAGDAPDICVTYDYPTIQTYADMGGVLDMNSYLSDNKDQLTNLWNLLGDDNIYWNQDPKTGTVWSVTAILAVNAGKNVFVREDWLKKLNMAEPKTVDEFEKMLVAFKDNASLLLGNDADKMIPFSISYDVGWRAFNLVSSYIPDNTTEKDFYVYGFDDRQLLLPNVKEGYRELNKWYNEGLIWKDFALYGAGDTTEASMMKAGYVGAYIQSWDDPYRNGDDSVQNNLKRLVGDDAAYVAIKPFQNDAGKYKQLYSAPVDRNVFFPATNDEPVASLMYLDWISTLENRMYLQIGEEGITHETTADGTIKTIAATGDYIMNSLNNIDYTITVNGLDLGDKQKTLDAIALGYSGVDPSYIKKAFSEPSADDHVQKNANAGAIKSEVGISTALSAKRDTLLAQAIVAPTADFDKMFDAGMQDYLNSGGQAIIDERKAAWEAIYGDATDLPEK